MFLAIACQGATPGLDSLAIGEIRELRGLERGFLKDGGSLRFDAVTTAGDTLRLFVDNNMELEDRGRLYVSVGSDEIPVYAGSQAEQALLEELRSWLERNFVRNTEGIIVGVSAAATDPSPTVYEAGTLERGLSSAGKHPD